MAEAVVQRVTFYSLEIPFRRRVLHAHSQRQGSESIVVSVEFAHGVTGYGETVPRPSSVEESRDAVLTTFASTFAPALIGFRAQSFPEALEQIEGLPWHDSSGAPVSAARAGIELALLDASMRFFGRGINDVVQWMGLPGFGAPGSLPRIRFSGILSANGIKTTMRQLRALYWFGLRDFKLPVGYGGDAEILGAVGEYLGPALRRNRASLRIDAHGAWVLAEALEWMAYAGRFPIAAIEQPLAKEADGDLAAFRDALIAGTTWKDAVPLRPMIVHDESLATLKDAKRLIDGGVADGFNLCIGKCGGLVPSLRMASLARRAGVCLQLGCRVGETSILSAAGLRFLEACPGVRWAEGCLGRLLLTEDVGKQSLHFGYAGRPPVLRGPGLGVQVEPVRLLAMSQGPPAIVNL